MLLQEQEKYHFNSALFSVFVKIAFLIFFSYVQGAIKQSTARMEEFAFKFMKPTSIVSVKNILAGIDAKTNKVIP